MDISKLKYTSVDSWHVCKDTKWDSATKNKKWDFRTIVGISFNLVSSNTSDKSYDMHHYYQSLYGPQKYPWDIGEVYYKLSQGK